ncbi:MAG: glycosyltransferase, partial [Jatrophihabitantaceae bacterium]
LDPRDVVRLVAAVEAGADLAIARRRPTSRSAWPLHARVANRELARRVRRRTGVPLRDIGPMRAARRVPLGDLGVTDMRFGYPLQTVVRAADAGWRLVAVDVDYHPRSGRSKVTGTIGGTVRAIRDMSAVLAS